MKVGFWGGGMPRWTHTERVARARELNCDGVTLGRASLGSLGLNTPDEELDEIRRTYAEAGVEVDMLSSSEDGRSGVDSDKFDWDAFKDSLVPLAQAAAKLGIPRIMPTVERVNEAHSRDSAPAVKWDWDDYLNNLARTSLAAVKDIPGVNVVFENHVSSASAQQLLEMVEKAGSERLGVVFSPDHCIVMQENPVELVDRYASAIQHVCLADRRPVEEDLGKFDGRYYYVRYEACVVGDGIVPIPEIMKTLDRHGYDGYIALKWEKTDLPRPGRPNGHNSHLPSGEAVLPSFVKYVKSFGVIGSRA